ncbi:YLP motif-containing protein 1 [Quillaja saponaria]|uniref:YLP motif-containing protein 1 n=1 Tax=Quillaja saponaria TaxID=32244 RepID=A0AAD7LFW3_QUISA|nr:YLP motif-containing protein 1 [Quillaja saponaria]
MDHQWRSRSTQGNVCPTCSVSHFPFCPPRPTYYQSPRFPFQGDNSFQRQGFDPYLVPPGMHGSYVGNGNGGYGDPSTFHRNPNWDRGSYGQLPLQNPIEAFRPVVHDHGNSNGYVDQDNRNLKRPRIDETGSGPGSFTGEYDKSFVSNLSEDERRLKLIRDHGGALGAPLEGKVGSVPLLDIPGVAEYRRNDEFQASELGPTATGNIDITNPHNRRGQLLRGEQCDLDSGQKRIQNNHNGFHSEVKDGVFRNRGGKDAISYFQNEEFPPSSQHCQVEGSPHHFHTFGTNNLGELQHTSQSVPYLFSKISSDNYHSDYPQQRQTKGLIATNGPNYAHMINMDGKIAPYPDQRGSDDPQNQLPQPYPMQAVPMRNEFQSSGLSGDTVHCNGVYYPRPTGGSRFPENMHQMEDSRVFHGQPPLPASPPPPLPVDPPMHPSSELKTYFSPPKASAFLFPVAVSSTAVVSSSHPATSEAHSMPQSYFQNKPLPQTRSGFIVEEPSNQYLWDAQPFPPKQLSSDPTVIDASHLFKQPYRSTRPDHIVIILRGLPGSGKSYMAKMLRDLEVENGGVAPRIHSMDDYFMAEVEKKVENNDSSKSSVSVRGKRPVMEYCYEPEMEEAYRESMLKAFKKTLEEGHFTFIIVDDRNLRVADFAQFWATAKRTGYEVYILEATYKDPAGCAARNVHGFTQDDIEKMTGKWEKAPSIYLQLDLKSLFHGDNLMESKILEVDMDMEDEDFGDSLPGIQERELGKVVEPPIRNDASDDSSKDGRKWDSEGDHPTEELRELGKSKWLEDFDEDDNERTDGVKGKINALSGLIHSYGKEGKSVRWGDKGSNAGFSIGAARKANMLSLVIGAGAGYNLKSNPLPEEDGPATYKTGETKGHSIFQEQIRAERESFKAVFDRRQHRIGGLAVEED